MSSPAATPPEEQFRFPLWLSFLTLTLAILAYWGLGHLDRRWSSIGLSGIGLAGLWVLRVIAEMVAHALGEVGVESFARRRRWVRGAFLGACIAFILGHLAWYASH